MSVETQEKIKINELINRLIVEEETTYPIW